MGADRSPSHRSAPAGASSRHDALPQTLQMPALGRGPGPSGSAPRNPARRLLGFAFACLPPHGPPPPGKELWNIGHGRCDLPVAYG